MILARLLSATPQTDGEHWDLSFRAHNDEWHTDAYAQNPAPYQRNPQLGRPDRVPYPWMPAMMGPWTFHDALFPNRLGFLLQINTQNSPPTLDIYGQTPVNAPPSGHAPQCPLEASVSVTGGSIVSGTYLIAISANDNGPVAPYFIKAVVPAGITTATLTVSGCVWQGAAAGIELFIGTSSLTMRRITDGPSWSGSSLDSYGNPTVFSVTEVSDTTTPGVGLPDPAFNSFLFRAKDISHGGVWGAALTSSSGSGGVGGNATLTFAGAAWATNQWAGYIVSSYSNTGAPVTGVSNYLVSSNTADTLTLSRAFSPPPPAGTVFVMRALSGSITSNTIGDANFANSYAPSGLAVNAEVGNLVRFIAGTGAGQPPLPIISNTGTVLTISGSWAVTPDATSIWIIESSAWRYSIPSDTISNSRAANPLLSDLRVGSIPLLNFGAGSLLVQVLTIDVNGNWSVERYAPLREIYVPAAANTALNPGYVTITPVAGLATIDLANGPLSSYLVVLDGSATGFAPIIYTGGSISPGMTAKLFLRHDATATTRPCPAFSNAAGGFVSNTQALIAAQLVDNPSILSEVIFTCQPGGLWSPGYIVSGISST